MADIAIFRINYKSDFILTLQSDAGWMTPFCIKFWTGAPSQAYFAGYDGTSYTHCAPVEGEPTKLLVQFDDHHLPIGDLKFQIGYHFTVADFPTSVEDEVINQAAVIIEVDDAPAQVMLDFNGETAPEIQFALPAYANEAQRIANEQARIAAEEQRIANEQARISAEETRQANEQQRINAEAERVSDFASLKTESEAATAAANIAATLANEKAQLADDKAALAQAAATLANAKAQLAADKAALAQSAATLANEKAALAQQKAEYAQEQGDAAKTEAETAHALNEEVRDDEEARDQAEQIRQQQETARQQAESQRVTDFNAQMQQQQTAYTNAEAARDTAFDEAETERDAKVDAKVADITNLQAQIGYFVCDTDADVAAKTIAATGYALTTGGNIRIKMTNANTVDNATLNINSTGAKPLFYEGARASSTNTWAADDVLEIYYDGTNYQAKNVSPTFKTGEKVYNVGVDDEPTAGSENLVKSGGVSFYTLKKIKEQDEKIKWSLKYNEEDNTLYVADAAGYVILKVDSSGITTTDVKIKYDNELITIAQLIYLLNSSLRQDVDNMGNNVNRLSVLLQKLLYAFNVDERQNEFIISDNQGYVGFKVDEDGIHFANNAFTNSDKFAVVDKFGYVGFKVDEDGVNYPGIVRKSDIPEYNSNDAVPEAKFGADINIFIAHGQSNSANGNYPLPAYDFENALCFASKTLVCSTNTDTMTEQELYQYLGNGFTSMNEYTGSLYTIGGCMVKWMQKLKSSLHLKLYDSLKYQFIGARTGFVTNIDILTDPSKEHYNRILRVVSAVKHFAEQDYKTVALPAIAYIQNEGNASMTFKHVYDMLWVFGSNINHDIKTITGQSENVVIFLYQTCQRFNQANDAMFQLSLDKGVEESYELDSTAASYLKPGVELIDRSIFVFSMPFYPYKTHETVNPLHLSWTDGIFNVFGAYFGLDAANIVNLESQKKVLYPISHHVRQINNKYVLEVKFDVPVEPLQFKPYSERFGNNASQTAVNGYEPNYGFKFADSNYSDSSIDMIESVETVRCDTVKFVLSQTPVGKWLFYAYGGSTSGGNLCDSQGNIETFMVGNDKYLMDNWCPMFSYYID